MGFSNNAEYKTHDGNQHDIIWHFCGVAVLPEPFHLWEDLLQAGIRKCALSPILSIT